MSCIITYKGKKYSEEQFKEYFINNKQEFVTSISKNKDVIDSFKRKMEGIDYVFSQSPELASIGSKAQYLQYLSTIFKTSQAKDILYHRTNNIIEKFDRSKTKSNAFYFNLNPNKGKFKYLVSAILNIKKYAALPINYTSLLGDKNAAITEDDLKKQGYDGAIAFKSLDKFVKINEDATVNMTKDISQETNILENNLDKKDSNEYVVFEPEQIHILGSKQDIQGFKNFVSFNPSEIKKGVEELFNENPAYFTKNNAFFIDHVTSEAMFDNIKSYLSFHYPGIKTYDDYRNYIFELNDKDTILNFINFVTKC